MSSKRLERFDRFFVRFFREYADEFARFALFVIFFWFGILKVFLVSPAGPLVVALLEATFLRGIPPEAFLIFFGLFEMVIGILALIPRLERITFALLVLHMITTVMPLFLLPDVTWSAAWVPTLMGQYIMKNIALLAISLLLFARLRPMTATHSIFGKEV